MSADYPIMLFFLPTTQMPTVVPWFLRPRFRSAEDSDKENQNDSNNIPRMYIRVPKKKHTVRACIAPGTYYIMLSPCFVKLAEISFWGGAEKIAT